jgi:uncharacterized SAM-binding protein YcdF (DUF218 family)
MARRFSLRISALVVLVLLCAAAVFTFRGVGRWLVCQSPLRPADVIVVLSGGLPWRAEEAANIFRRGDGHEVWITRGDSPADELAAMGIQYLGEDYFTRQVLVHNGIPDADIRVLPESIVNTQQEVTEIARELRRQGKASAIIVTSPPHTRRVRALWRKLVGSNPTAIVRAAPQAPFDADHWWRNTRDTYAVVRELMGLVNAWIDLPVHPHSTETAAPSPSAPASAQDARAR